VPPSIYIPIIDHKMLRLHQPRARAWCQRHTGALNQRRVLSSSPVPLPSSRRKTPFQSILAFESRFIIPEMGMREPEYLSRGSAILLQRTHPVTGRKMAGIATSQHIAHPFSTPFYYQEAMSWLGKVRPQHCSFYVSIGGLKGPIWEMELDRDMLRVHDSLDVCLFQLPSDEAEWFLTQLATLADQALVNPVPFRETADPFPPYATVDCVGYDFSLDTGSDSVTQNRFKVVPGRVQTSEYEWSMRKKVGSDGTEVVRMQEFRVESEQKLQFGMCGGPVVLGHDPTRFLGIIEGIDNVSGVVHCLPADTVWSLFDEHI